MDKDLSTAVGWAIIAIPIVIVFAAIIIANILSTELHNLSSDIHTLDWAVRHDGLEVSIAQADDLLKRLEQLHNIEQGISSIDSQLGSINSELGSANVELSSIASEVASSNMEALQAKVAKAEAELERLQAEWERSKQKSSQSSPPPDPLL